MLPLFRPSHLVLPLSLAVALAVAAPAFAGDPGPGAERSLSPYLYVGGGDATTDQLPLKSTSAEVQIAGVIARVRVR
jgi:hypothetical protein